MHIKPIIILCALIFVGILFTPLALADGQTFTVRDGEVLDTLMQGVSDNDTIIIKSGANATIKGNPGGTYSHLTILCEDNVYLTIEDLNIQGNSKGQYPIQFIGGQSTLYLSGHNTLSDVTDGLLVQADLTIRGTGRLDIRSASPCISVEPTGSLSLSAGDYRLESSRAIHSLGPLAIYGGHIISTGDILTEHHDLSIHGGIIRTDGLIYATSTATPCNLTIYDGTIHAKGIGSGKATNVHINILGGHITTSNPDNMGIGCMTGRLNIRGGYIHAADGAKHWDIGVATREPNDFILSSDVTIFLSRSTHSPIMEGEYNKVVFALRDSGEHLKAGTMVTLCDANTGYIMDTVLHSDDGKIYGYMPAGTYCFTTEDNTKKTLTFTVEGDLTTTLDFDTNAKLEHNLTLAGRVLDDTGMPIPDLLIMLDSNPDVIRTDSQGYYSIDGVSPTNHTLTIMDGNAILTTLRLRFPTGMAYSWNQHGDVLDVFVAKTTSYIEIAHTMGGQTLMITQVADEISQLAPETTPDESTPPKDRSVWKHILIIVGGVVIMGFSMWMISDRVGGDPLDAGLYEEKKETKEGEDK